MERGKFDAENGKMCDTMWMVWPNPDEIATRVSRLWLEEARRRHLRVYTEDRRSRSSLGTAPNFPH